jgi:hypothetical protein
MNLSDLQKMFNRRALINHKRAQMKMNREKRKKEKTMHRLQMHRKKWQDRKDKGHNRLVSLRFLDKNFIINV